MSNRRNFLIFVALMGLIAFYNVASSPRFAAIHAIDVIRLLAAGMCFGAAIAALWRSLTVDMFDAYRPERHYMRGPGPKWRAKQGFADGTA